MWPRGLFRHETYMLNYRHINVEGWMSERGCLCAVAVSPPLHNSSLWLEEPTSLILKKAMPVSKESEPAWCCGPILSSSSCSATSCSPPWKQNTQSLKIHASSQSRTWEHPSQEIATEKVLCAACWNIYLRTFRFLQLFMRYLTS